MNNNELQTYEDEVEINLVELFQAIISKMKMIIIVTLLCAVITGTITVFFISKKYESTARIYPKPETSGSVVDYSQINANNLMVNNYMEMIKGNNIQSIVAEDLDIDVKELSNCVSISNEANTQIISITAKTKDPALSKKIVDSLISTFKKEAKETLNINNITTIDQAQLETTPVSPNLFKNIIIGAFIGIVLSVGYVFIQFMLDTHIHNKEEAEKYLCIPNLGSIPFYEE